MRRLILAGVAAASLATPALASERQFVCQGQASGARGEKVNATIYLGAKGERLTTFASWDPPRIEGPLTAKADAPDLSFTIMYNDAGARGIGSADNGLITVMAFAPPGEGGSVSPDRQLAGMTIGATIDGAAEKTLPLLANPMIDDLPMTAFREAGLTVLPDSTRTVSLRLTDREQKPVAMARYELSDATGRDRLFATAWQAAEEAARVPDRCEVTAESD